LANNRNFSQKSKFWLIIEILAKIEIFAKNRNFSQTPNFWLLIEILAKRQNFGY